MDLELKDKVALVTAASSGIGRAAALRLAEEGARVVIVGRNETKLREVTEGRANITSIQFDLSSPETQDLVSRVVGQHGQLDIVVLNTGGPTIQPFISTSLDQWDAAFGSLFRPVVSIAHGAANHMVSRGSGAILFLTSTWAKQPAVGSCLSISMRAGLSALSKLMALELAPAGVRVNQLMPGATATDRMEALLEGRIRKSQVSREVELEKSYADIPFRRWARPEETADAIAFLVSARAAYVTGQTLAVDGGSLKSVF